MPDLQSAWQLLVQCAGLRANHLLRTLPPTQSQSYAGKHDEGMWAAAQTLLGGLPGTADEQATARDLASLPMRLGGAGLRSAERTGAAAYWASWADALAMINARLPLPLLLRLPHSFPRRNLLPALQVALTRPVTRDYCFHAKAFCSGLAGKLSAAVCARRRILQLSPVNGRTAGSTTLPQLENTTFEVAPCCHSRHPPTAPTCARSLAALLARH